MDLWEIKGLGLQHERHDKAIVSTSARFVLGPVPWNYWPIELN